MQLKTAIACVHYDDFLAQTLPHNLPFLDNVTVVTSSGDQATMAVARRLGVEVLATDAWYLGGTFNKARALNHWWSQAASTEPETWLLTLDADMLLFDSVPDRLRELEPSCLYGAHRRLCEDEASLHSFFSGGMPFSSFPRDAVPLINGKLWGLFPQQNAAGLTGFFQLWCPTHSSGLTEFPLYSTAEAYDVAFGLSFPENARRWLPMHDALHLGPREVNWEGRRSPRWRPVALGGAAS